jgi:hypothetical protein
VGVQDLRIDRAVEGGQVLKVKRKVGMGASLKKNSLEKGTLVSKHTLNYVHVPFHGPVDMYMYHFMVQLICTCTISWSS